MKDKGKVLLVVGVLLIFTITIHIVLSLKENNEVPKDYIAVFHGGAGEITYETYIYKIDNGQANMGFEYVNTTNTTKSWGSSEWNSKVTGRGTVTWTDDVFTVAEKNHAYSYVTLPKSNEVYSIEQFATRFLMD